MASIVYAGTEPVGTGPPARVLIVDDEQESLKLLQRTLRGRYETFLAGDGREGLGFLERHPVAVVISDQRMPGMTGVEFLAEASRRCPNTQRVLLTAYTEVEGIIEAINAGHVFGYVSKPWHPEDLLTTLRRAVETYRLLEDKDRLVKDLHRKNEELRGLLQQTKQLEAARIQAERWAALGRLAGMVAHDLRSPLTAIQCQAGLLRDRDPVGANGDRSVHAILEQVQRMRHIIDELFLFARPKNGSSSRRPYELSALVASVQEAFSLRCDGKGIRLETDLEYDGIVWIRPSQVYRVLENLVKNALEAVGERGEILIASDTAAGREVVLRVADSGPGIPESIRKDLFEPFVTRDKPGGTGLGLAIVRKIVCEHGGRVWEEPWRLQGACFHLALPLGPPAEGGG